MKAYQCPHCAYLGRSTERVKWVALKATDVVCLLEGVVPAGLKVQAQGLFDQLWAERLVAERGRRIPLVKVRRRLAALGGRYPLGKGPRRRRVKA